MGVFVESPRETLLRADARSKEVIGRFAGMIGSDPAMLELYSNIKRVARSKPSVLLGGETGSGKELAARAIHASSARSDGPFEALNCSSIDKALAESELLGCKKGAFTDARSDYDGAFRRAHKGTLFLDELGELNLEVQAKLLRALGTGQIKPMRSPTLVEVDVRVVAATNVDLRAAYRRGTFREDLFFRLQVIELHMPPLRARKSDLRALIKSFAEEFSPWGVKIRVTPEAREKLLAYDWPGNARELKNTIQRSILLRRSDELGVEDLKLGDESVSKVPRAPAGDSLLWRHKTLEEVVDELIGLVYADTGGRQQETRRNRGYRAGEALRMDGGARDRPPRSRAEPRGSLNSLELTAEGLRQWDKGAKLWVIQLRAGVGRRVRALPASSEFAARVRCEVLGGLIQDDQALGGRSSVG